MSINIMDFEVVLRDKNRDLPIIVEAAVEGEYRIFAPTAVSLNVFVEMLPFWALVATMDGENLYHPCDDNTRPWVIDGQFPNFFTASEKGKGRVSLRSQRDYDHVGMMFLMQGAAHRLVMDFFEAVNSTQPEGKSWMGTTLVNDDQQWMQQRGMSGLPAPAAPSAPSALQVPPYGEREISAVFEDEGYFNPERKLRVVIEFLEIDEFNKRAAEAGMSEWDPYAKEV